MGKPFIFIFGALFLMAAVLKYSAASSEDNDDCADSARFRQLGAAFAAGQDPARQRGTSSEEGESYINEYVSAYNSVYPEANVQILEFLDNAECLKPFLEGYEAGQ